MCDYFVILFKFVWGVVNFFKFCFLYVDVLLYIFMNFIFVRWGKILNYKYWDINLVILFM